MKLVDLQRGYAKIEMRFTQDLENMFGMAHGGAIFSLIDAAFELASNSHGTMAIALSMNINYLASPGKGTLLTAEAKEINRTKKTAAYDIRASDDILQEPRNKCTTPRDSRKWKKATHNFPPAMIRQE